MKTNSGVPAVWCIDVEPDNFQATGEPWAGFEATVALVDRLRGPLSEASGSPLRITWTLRLDAAIERICDGSDFVFRRHGDLIEHLAKAGDSFGIHTHAYRWDDARSAWYSDHIDRAWTRHCLELAAATFATRLGHPPRISRMGGYYLSDVVIDTYAELGIEVDLSAEPGLPPLPADLSHGSWANAPSTDFRDYPTRPHRRAGGRLLLVPVSSYDTVGALMPRARRVARRLAGRPPTGLRPLSMWRPWPSPQVYWDLVGRMLDEAERPYFAWATRSDVEGIEVQQRVVALLEHLPTHPVARRLRYTSPLAPEVAALAG